MNWYAMLLGLGASLGLLQVARAAPPRESQNRLNAAMLVLLTSLGGARLVYVLFHWGYYAKHLVEVLQVWQGGMAWPGAVAGSLLGVGVSALAWHLPFRRVLDGLTPLLPPIAVAAWLGGWLVGSGYGMPVHWGLLVADESGILEKRVPLQLAAAGILLGVFTWLEFRPPKIISRPGQKSYAAWMALALVMLGASFLRGDPLPLWLGLRPDAWASIVLALAAAMGMLLPQDFTQPS